MSMLRILWQAGRRLARRPGHTAILVLVLGVGLGVVGFLFSLVQRTVLEPLPFAHAERLMVVGHAHVDGIGIGHLGSHEWLAIKDALQGVRRHGAFAVASYVLKSGADTPASFEQGGQMTASTLHMLGAQPLLGRGLTAADEQPGATPVALLSAALWRHRFHSDKAIVGRRIQLNGRWRTVVGVMPARFQFPGQARLWTPLNLKRAQDFDVEGLVELAPAASLAALRQQLAILQPQLDRLIHGAHRARKLTAKPLAIYAVHEDIRRWVGLMFAAGCLVLLLACMNVANLQLVQVLSRRHELALRGALGCGRPRLVLEAFLGSLWLSAAALLVAVPIMHGCDQWLIQTYADNDQALSSFTQRGVGALVLGFVVAMAVLCTGLASVIPVWRVSRGDVSSLLRDGSKGSASGFARVARVLVVAEIALTVVLLTGAGTLVKTLRQILAQPAAGHVAAEQILTASLAFPVGHDDDPQRSADVRRLLQHLREDPALLAVTAANIIPDYDYGSDEYIAAQGQSRPAQGWMDAHTGIVDRSFLATYGVSILKGRFFGPRDDATGTPVAVIDSVAATRLWPGREALGQTLVLHPEAHAETFKIVGVIAPLHASGPFDPPQPEVLLPWRQMAGESSLQSLALHTRAPLAESYLPRLRQRVQQVLPQAAVYRGFSQARLERMDRVGLWVLSQVFSALGLVALGLAGLGLYGVLAFSVAQRTREIGIRRAIGAGHRAIVRHVVQRLVWQAGLGLLIGLALAWPWTSLLARSGLRMQPHDMSVYALTVAVIVFAMMLATWLPLWRAMRVDPAVALRYE